MKITKAEKAKLNALLREVMLLRDGSRCLWCHTTERLQMSHIYPKGRYRQLEFDIDNVKTLCWPCHFHKWHKNPLEAHGWLETAIPRERLERLRLRKIYTESHKDPIDYSLVMLELKKLKESYEKL